MDVYTTQSSVCPIDEQPTRGMSCACLIRCRTASVPNTRSVDLPKGSKMKVLLRMKSASVGLGAMCSSCSKSLCVLCVHEWNDFLKQDSSAESFGQCKMRRVGDMHICEGIQIKTCEWLLVSFFSCVFWTLFWFNTRNHMILLNMCIHIYTNILKEKILHT